MKTREASIADLEYLMRDGLEDSRALTQKGITVNKNILRKALFLLEEGEKYKAIVKEIEYELEWHKPEEPLHTAKLEVTKDEEYLNEILDMIANIKQKYFPEPTKKTIIIEIEADNEEIIRDQFQILSTQLFKNRQGKKSRQSFGYVIKYEEGD